MHFSLSRVIYSNLLMELYKSKIKCMRVKNIDCHRELIKYKEVPCKIDTIIKKVIAFNG